MSQNYKDTLNLPRTEFPMKANLAAREPEMLKAWEETHLYEQIQKSREGRDLFVLHDGPPFANGDVHMGTALNKILKDFMVKSQTMLGKRAPYIPGWDCHGFFDYERPIYLVIWTTTPWTLPANLAVAFNARMNYSIVERGTESYILGQTAHEVPVVGLISPHEPGGLYGTSVKNEVLSQ